MYKDLQECVIQKKLIKSYLDLICGARGFSFDNYDFDNCDEYITQNGEIKVKGKDMNIFYDSDTFDARATVNGLDMFFVTNYLSPLELGKIVENISKNQDNNTLFFIVVSPAYFDSVAISKLNIPENCVVTSANTLHQFLNLALKNRN